tara:strand:+ start:10570 stop:10728 length:159 start_codon:yes stop_codon:yes gene_type:complete
MPNEWMDEISLIVDRYYDQDITYTAALAKINLIVQDYQSEFEMFESQFKDKQ